MSKRGEFATFDDRFGELFAAAMRPAWRMLGSREEAENVAAEVLARALVRWRSLRDSPQLVGWVTTVSTNLSIQHLRKTRRSSSRVAQVTEPMPVVDRLDLTEAVSSLPRRQREAVTLHYFLDLTESDIAAELGISVSSVKTHLQRALKSLRRQLTDLTEAPVGLR